MGKILVGLVMMWFMVSGVAFGYTTWEEAMNAGLAEYSNRNAPAARIAFNAAVTISTNANERICASEYIAMTYYIIERDYAKALLSFQETVNIIDGSPLVQSSAHYFMGLCHKQLGNNADAVQAFITVFATPSASPERMGTAFQELLALSDINTWKMLVDSCATNTVWGYFYRAKAKVLSTPSDKKGALQDLNAGLKPLSQEQKAERQIIGTERETITFDGWGITYAEYVAKYGEP